MGQSPALTLGFPWLLRNAGLLRPHALQEFNDFYKLSTLSIRLFSVYGARQPTTGPQAGVIGRFMDMLAKVRECLLVAGRQWWQSCSCCLAHYDLTAH